MAGVATHTVPGVGLPHDLVGKVAIVLGAERRNSIGRSVATALAARGAEVAVTGTAAFTSTGDPGWRGADSVRADLTERLGVRASSHLVDVLAEEQVDRLVADVAGQHGRVDILVNTAAVPAGDASPVTEIRLPDWQRTLAVNLTGAMLASRAAVRWMIEHDVAGRIVSIGSVHGREGVAFRAAYSASKFGLVGLMQSLAQELAVSGITVNTVCPGVVATDRVSGADEESLRRLVGKIPMGRMATGQDIGEVVAFLCTPAAAYITGQALNVDGGWQMR
ncbi:SDR family NAD(P)-dependent oxidoreductase [Amycolatopsis sp. GM8]|uniref:SDR family NAD(P)-dependent oxidoreductase n=1 Tax=Amycolatopsis sp. GM8 TaxID=2896530 RepID=UPI001F164091|nr:SDR family NAD(P)-dependent oxidoreductase [Amycolatopsis sp. GM8]